MPVWEILMEMDYKIEAIFAIKASISSIPDVGKFAKRSSIILLASASAAPGLLASISAAFSAASFL